MSTYPLVDAPPLRRRPVPVVEPRPAFRVMEPRTPSVDRHQQELNLGDPPPDSPARGPAHRPGQTPSDGRRPDPEPPPDAWVRQFVHVALEVAAGLRPISQLLRWTSPDVFTALARRNALSTRLALSGLSPTQNDRARPITTGVPRSCRLTGTVVETCVVARDRDRFKAVALRLETVRGRWRVTALEIG